MQLLIVAVIFLMIFGIVRLIIFRRRLSQRGPESLGPVPIREEWRTEEKEIGRRSCGRSMW